MKGSFGVTRGVESLLDARLLPVRLAVLLALAVGCLLLLSDGASAVDWVIGLAAVLVTAGGVRYPLPTALAAGGLLVAGFEFGDTGPVVAKVAAGFALAELTARRGGWQALIGAAALAGAYLLHPVGGSAVMVYRAVVMAVVPLLIGGLLRAAWTGARTAERENRELAERREAEVAAARATERTAIARELHDLVAHHISSTVLRVGVARHAVPDAPPALLEVLDEIHASGRETLVDLRKLVAILRDPAATSESFIAPADLPVALREAAERARRHGRDITADISEDIATVDALRGLTLLRLTQEGLANLAKHADPAATARLHVTVDTSGAVDFELRDNGSRARSGVRVDERSGLGLVGLRERVELLGGSLTAGPDGAGWRLAARLPARIEVSA